MTARFIVGNTRAALASLAAERVGMFLTVEHASLGETV
jgi:hypothetical protein